MPPEEQSAGATPVVEGATPSQTSPATPPATGQSTETQEPTATEGTEQLGDAGKRALDRMKAERDEAVKAHRTLQARVDELENASKSEAEKAIGAARKEGEQAATSKWSGVIRGVRVEQALAKAGAIDPSVAAQAREFAQLGVADDGSVTDLDKTVEAFKAAHPALFGQAPKASGDFGGGSRSGGSTNKPASTLEEAVAAQLG